MKKEISALTWWHQEVKDLKQKCVSRWREIGEKFGYWDFFKNHLTEKVTRLEIINHSSNKETPYGRAFVHWDDKTKIELSLQDDDRTLKIFIIDKK